MLRIKCPHCGAGNQDATEADTCWQCGTVLGAPVARAQTAEPAAPSPSLSAPTQQLNPELLANLPLPQRQEPAKAPERRINVALLVACLVLVALLLVVIFALTTRH